MKYQKEIKLQENDLSAEIIQRLEQWQIPCKTYTHEAVFTVEQGRHLHAIIPGGHCRNLFLRDKKKNFFLISALESTEIDLRLAEKLIGARGRLSFGKAEDLLNLLRVKAGSVNPFALFYDRQKQVQPILDHHLFEHEQVNFHPMRNDQSTVLTPQDLEKYIKNCGHTPRTVDFSGRGY